MAVYPDWTPPSGCRCRVRQRDDIPGYDRWLDLDLAGDCRVHQLDVPAVGQSVRVVQMGPDPDPLPPGTTGTVTDVTPLYDGTVQLAVDWDDGRSLLPVLPVDLLEAV